MTAINGISCVYYEDEGFGISEAFSYQSSFSDIISATEKVPAKGLALVSFDGEECTHLLFFRKSGRVATKKVRLSFSKPIELTPPVSVSKLTDAAPKSV